MACAIALQGRGLAQSTDAPLEPEPSSVPRRSLLLPEQFPGKTWVFFSGKKGASIEQTWVVDSSSAEGPVLICTGEPHGYLRTTTAYSDFDFGLEWKYPTDEAGNSGILLCATGEDRIWPSAVQVQLHQPKTGSIFGSGGALVDPEIETQNHFTRPVNHWNELIISSRSGRLVLTINGKLIGETQVQTTPIGCIGLQSEGSEIHFRRLWLRDLQSPREVPAAAPGEPSAFHRSPCWWGPMICECAPGQTPFTSPFAPAPWPGVAYTPGWEWSPSGRSFNRELRHGAVGVPLADDPDLLRTGRGARLNSAAAGEWSTGAAGRGVVRIARGGRGRR